VDRHGHINAVHLTAPAVVLVLRRHAARAGLDREHAAGRSLRAGLGTSASAVVVPERVIAAQTSYRGGDTSPVHARRLTFM
jgi:hypothetical protein